MSASSDADPPSLKVDQVATRAAGLQRLKNFLPRAGRQYTARRNHDFGPDNRANVSLLSPYIRHRLITEEEVVAAVLTQHSPDQVEKFIQEVFWRTYWKGWLEQRPGTWSHYQDELGAGLRAIESNAKLRHKYDAAIAATTGIDCMDAWVKELVETGYLHNHARMWFASIWIFTLGLPWALGADFFYRHLLDGDPASNTLSWRWVAGMQTRGKHYLAYPDNIDKYTRGRFARPTELNTDAPPLPAPSMADRSPLPTSDSLPDGARMALLLTEDDLYPESLGIRATDLVSTAALLCTTQRSSLAVSEPVRAFAAAAVADGLSRAAAHWDVPAGSVHGNAESLVAWARSEQVDALVCAYAPVGPVQSELRRAKSALDAANVKLVQVVRDWDQRAWPHATRGFFPFKAKIPGLLPAPGLPQ